MQIIKYCFISYGDNYLMVVVWKKCEDIKPSINTASNADVELYFELSPLILVCQWFVLGAYVHGHIFFTRKKSNEANKLHIR